MNTPEGEAVAGLLRKAQALRASKATAALHECLAAAARLAGTVAAAHAAIGDFCTLGEDYPAAHAAYDKAVRLAPDQIRYRFNRAAVLRFLGQLDAAEQDYDAIIAAHPDDAEAWLNRSELRIQTGERNHVSALEQWAARGFSGWRQEVPVRFALAKEYEDLGLYADSWRQLHAGAALRRGHLQYDVNADLATVDWIRAAFPEALTHSDGDPSGEPIFIVGMPRTGTTLLERILGGHRDVFAAGELAHFALAVVAATKRATGRPDLGRSDLIAASARADFRELGADYLSRTRPRTGHTRRFVDKMPLNYLYCGLIRRALPGARILHLTRHPMATCYAVYKTLFNQGYPFSYDLAELADYYAGYRRLMAHWHEALPGQILDVSYERLVTDPMGESQRVFEYCGLEWSPGCLDFHQGTSATTTASAAQVRRPIYRSSVDLWRHYATQLAPVAQRLDGAGIAGLD